MPPSHRQHSNHRYIDTSLGASSPVPGSRSASHHANAALTRDHAPPALSSPNRTNRREPSPHSTDNFGLDSPNYYEPSPSKDDRRRPSQDTTASAATWHSCSPGGPDDTFLDSHTLADADMSDHRSSRVPQPPRDSHDLSLSPRDVTRDSLVTNMLMSLDQFSFQPTNTQSYPEDDEQGSPRFFDVPRYRPSNQTPRAGGPPLKGHGHSYSSDLEGVGDDASRLSSQYSRGRRSNSSTNFPDNYSRLNSARQPASPRGGAGGAHARGSKGSKSSSINSFDGAHVQGNGTPGQQRFGGGAARAARTSSFDNGDPQHMRSVQTWPQLQDVPQSPFRTDFIDDFVDHDDIDAAPTPTVPPGPRRSPSTPVIHRPPPEPKQTPSSPHRNRSSSRSVKSSTGRGKAHMQEPAPPLPMTPKARAEAESAPAPNVGYGKSKEADHGPKAPAAVAPPQPKEKQGFFKRVFGGGSSKNTPAKNPPADNKRSSRVDSTDLGNSERPNGDSPQLRPKTGVAAPPRETTSSHSNHPTLQKKSSSFFRRRLRSATTDAPPLPKDDAPPVPPIKINEDKYQSIPKPEDSPVSSLRQVMNPYLRHSQGTNSHLEQGGKPSKVLGDITNVVNSRDDQGGKREEYKREFSPEYEPSPNARIRKVQSNLERNDDDHISTPSKSTSQKDNKGSSFLDLDGGSENEEEQAAVPRESSRPSTQRMDSATTPVPKKKSSFIKPSSAESSPHHSNLGLPIEGAQGSRAASPRPPSRTPELRVQTSIESSPKPSPKVKVDSLRAKPLDEPDFVVGDPTEDDRSKAQKIYDGNEDFIQKEKAAAWMGEEGPVRQRTLQAYIELYDFASQSVVYSLRQVCSRLVFRAETQQVDRILVAFSKRWCSCNPNHGFKAIDVIHTICYSIMLLNTDLHMADIESKMTRSQFVKNTMGTITQALEEAVPNAFDKRPSILSEKGPSLTVEEVSSPAPSESEKKSFRNSFRPPPRRDSEGELLADCGPLVKNSYHGTMKGWEEQVELVLKGIYASIRDERLPLFGADSGKSIPPTPSPSNLSVMGMLKRTPSVLSKAPSEGNLSLRGRNVENNRGPAARWTSKSRSRQGFSRNGFNSSRTSFDDGNSLWSPAMSSATWSRQSLGRTQTSVSQDSFGSSLPRGDYQQSIGFANALSQAFIKDEDAFGSEMAPSILSTDISSTQLLEDESLEITGSPWLKEGMIIHKHHLDGVEKKAKDRNWTEVFAVIQKGQMSLFSFNASKSMRQKSRTRSSKQHGPVGGGNWQDNATSLGTFNLRHTLASALPSPGYSRTRPHVWALSLPTGAVHLFQVGTAEIIKEFVTTANYWSARLSTHPLTGGVSNIEYGWSDSIVNNALVSAINDTSSNTPARGTSRPGSSAAHGRKSSISSFRSASIDQATAAFTHASGRGKLPGDRVHIAEWAPPTQSLRPSTLAEAEQLENLTVYMKSIENQLQDHNRLRSPMLLAFTPRGYNAGKAMTNWERKSAYLLHENVKFNTYIDCLQQAEHRKQEIYAERNLAQRAARGELTDRDMEVSDGEEGDETLRP